LGVLTIADQFPEIKLLEIRALAGTTDHALGVEPESGLRRGHVLQAEDAGHGFMAGVGWVDAPAADGDNPGTCS